MKVTHMRISVYCSGSIRKGNTDDKKLCWGDAEREEVRRGAAPRDIIFLNPDDPITDPTNTLGQFGRDLFQVTVSDAIVVDARQRRGLGIGVEMAAAATCGTPVIVVAPRNSKYRSDELSYRGTTVKDYVHPHVAALATHLVDGFFEAGLALARLGGRAELSASRPVWLTSAVAEYRHNVMPGDAPMLAAAELMGWDEPNRAN